MSIEKKTLSANIFYDNRAAIAEIGQAYHVDAGTATAIWAQNNHVPSTGPVREEWDHLMIWYQNHKTLTLADLFHG